MILKCNCTGTKRGNTQAADYQNHKYGYGMRVCNETVSPHKPRCTVCGFEVQGKDTRR